MGNGKSCIFIGLQVDYDGEDIDFGTTGIENEWAGAGSPLFLSRTTSSGVAKIHAIEAGDMATVVSIPFFEEASFGDIKMSGYVETMPLKQDTMPVEIF